MKRWANVFAVASMCVGCGGTEGVAPEATTSAISEAPAAAGAAVAATAPGPAASVPARPAAPAPAVPQFREVTLPAGTTLPLRLQSAVASDTSRVEDAVRAELREAVSSGGATVLPAGTEFAGTVTSVERSGRVKGVARVAYRFDSLTLGGTRYEVGAAPLVHEAEATKGEDATKVAIGAGAGAAVGALLGGGSGAAKGAAIGAAGGTGLVLATRGEEVRIESGASVTTTLSAPLTIRVRAN